MQINIQKICLYRSLCISAVDVKYPNRNLTKALFGDFIIQVDKVLYRVTLEVPSCLCYSLIHEHSAWSEITVWVQGAHLHLDLSL